jgi:hypothetical protein
MQRIDLQTFGFWALGKPSVRRALVLALLSAVPPVANSADAAPPFLFVENFESGVMDFEKTFIQSGNAPTITQERVRAGKYAMKSYLNRETSEVNFRTEVVPRMTEPAFGRDTWYGFSIFLPESYEISQTWEVLAQWHDTPNDWDTLHRQNPPMQLGIQRDTGIWRLTMLWDKDPVQPGNIFQIDGVKTWDFASYERNKWTDWVFQIRWSYNGDGLLRVWKDGKLVVDHQGPNTYNDNVGPYFKMGMYKGWRDSQAVDSVKDRSVYHDELRIAGPNGRYEDVAPGGAASTQRWSLTVE